MSCIAVFFVFYEKSGKNVVFILLQKVVYFVS